MSRKASDCRKFPSEKNCSLYISGTEEEVLSVSIDHAIKDHGHQDTPEFREEMKKFLVDAND